MRNTGGSLTTHNKNGTQSRTGPSAWPGVSPQKIRTRPASSREDAQRRSGMRIKTTVREATPTGCETVATTVIEQVLRERRETGASRVADGDVNGAAPEESSLGVPLTVRQKFTRASRPPPGPMPKRTENGCSNKCLCTNIHGSTNNRKMAGPWEQPSPSAVGVSTQCGPLSQGTVTQPQRGTQR